MFEECVILCLVMIMETPNDSAKLIVQRLQSHFKRLPHTRYWMVVVNNSYDRQYNFFIEMSHRQRCTRSIPLHSITDYSLINLEHVIQQVHLQNKLPIHFRGFGDQQRWPESGRLIRAL